jgi:hypothetical protein
VKPKEGLFRSQADCGDVAVEEARDIRSSEGGHPGSGDYTGIQMHESELGRPCGYQNGASAEARC